MVQLVRPKELQYWHSGADFRVETIVGWCLVTVTMSTTPSMSGPTFMSTLEYSKSGGIHSADFLSSNFVNFCLKLGGVQIRFYSVPREVLAARRDLHLNLVQFSGINSNTVQLVRWHPSSETHRTSREFRRECRTRVDNEKPFILRGNVLREQP